MKAFKWIFDKIVVAFFVIAFLAGAYFGGAMFMGIKPADAAQNITALIQFDKAWGRSDGFNLAPNKKFRKWSGADGGFSSNGTHIAVAARSFGSVINGVQLNTNSTNDYDMLWYFHVNATGYLNPQGVNATTFAPNATKAGF